MSVRDVERALVEAMRGGATVSYVDGVVDTVTPYLVLCTGDETPGEVEPLVARAAEGSRVAVFSVGAHRFAIPFPPEA